MTLPEAVQLRQGLHGCLQLLFVRGCNRLAGHPTAGTPVDSLILCVGLSLGGEMRKRQQVAAMLLGQHAQVGDTLPIGLEVAGPTFECEATCCGSHFPDCCAGEAWGDRNDVQRRLPAEGLEYSGGRRISVHQGN